MNVVALTAGAADPIIASHAIRFHERLLGRRAPGCLDTLLMETSSVHTVGLKESISVVGLDGNLVVVAARILKPNRVAWFRKARHILEMPGSAAMPRVGDRLVLTDV